MSIADGTGAADSHTNAAKLKPYELHGCISSNRHNGRQLFESVFTKSNDTKMIPNAFDGISPEIKEFSKTKIQLACFMAQK